MQIPHFFLIYFMLLIASTFAIVGWHKSTEGEEHKMPDGTTERTGNIFRAWRFFWMQEHKSKLRYYFDRKHMLAFLPEFHNYNRSGVIGRPNKDGYASIELHDSQLESLIFIESQLGVKFEIEMGNMGSETSFVYVYKEEPHYVFPWWLRKMMASCITCHASVYGTIIFAFFHGLFWDTLKVEMYGSVRDITAAVILTWIAYTLSLAYTLTYAYKKA